MDSNSNIMNQTPRIEDEDEEDKIQEYDSYHEYANEEQQDEYPGENPSEAPQEAEEQDPELLDKDAVLIFFNQIGISESTKEVLIKNGFDNFESLSYISRDVLIELNIEDAHDANSLLDSLSSIAECYRNSASMKEALSAYQKCIPGTAMTEKLIMQTKNKKSSSKSTRVNFEYLSQINHLSLENRGISIIENLEKCSNLKVIYLYENKIAKIQGLEKCTKVTHLSLEKNLISKIEGLDTLVNLQKLYLENNCISKLEGLTGNPKLEELNLSCQNLSPGQDFEFDDLSL